MNSPKTLVSISLLRIIAAFGVVLIHTTDPFILFKDYIGGSSWWLVYFLNNLSRISVPLFVIISGYLLLNGSKIDDIGAFYKKRLNRVGIPLLSWFVAFLLWMHFWSGVSLTPAIVWDTFVSVRVGPLYFLVIILELYLLTPLLFRFVSKNGKVLLRAVVVLGTFSALSAMIPYFFFNDSFRFSENILMIALPYAFYYVLGGYLRNVAISRLMAWVFFALYIVFSAIITVIAYGNPRSFAIHYFNPIVMLMSAGVFVSVLHFESFFTKRIGGSLKRLVLLFAGASLGIYLIHIYVLDVLLKSTSLRPGSIFSPLWGAILLLAFMTFLISFVIVFVGKKVPLLRKILE